MRRVWIVDTRFECDCQDHRVLAEPDLRNFKCEIKDRFDDGISRRQLESKRLRSGYQTKDRWTLTDVAGFGGAVTILDGKSICGVVHKICGRRDCGHGSHSR